MSGIKRHTPFAVPVTADLSNQEIDVHKRLLPMIGILTTALVCGCNNAKSPTAVATDVAAARQQASGRRPHGAAQNHRLKPIQELFLSCAEFIKHENCSKIVQRFLERNLLSKN